MTLLQNLLHNLLLLDQERPNNPIPHTVCAPRASIGARHRFLRLGHRGELTRSSCWEAWQLDLAVAAFRRCTTLLDVEVSKLATGGLDNAGLVGTSIVAGQY